MGQNFASALNHSTSTIQQINISHMSLCVKLLDETWICGSSAEEIVNNIKEMSRSDPFNLVWAADKYRNECIFYPLM